MEKQEQEDVQQISAAALRETLRMVLPYCCLNYSHTDLNSHRNRPVYERSLLCDAAAAQYQRIGRAYYDLAYQTRVYTEVAPTLKLDSGTIPPAQTHFFEVHEWDLLNATHRQLLRNALVAQVRLVQLRENVGYFFTHPLRNVYVRGTGSAAGRTLDPMDSHLRATSNAGAADLRAQQMLLDMDIMTAVERSTRDGAAKQDAGRRGAGEQGRYGLEGEELMVCSAISVIEAPQHDVSLLDLLVKPGPIPEGILGSILIQLTAILERLHIVCGCVHNDLDARNVFICPRSGIVKLSNFFFAFFPKRSPGTDIAGHCEPKVVAVLQFPLASV